MEFEWDDGKNQLNVRKHRLAFEDAVEVFADPDEVTVPANSVGGEDRWKIVGKVRETILTVIFTRRDRAGGAMSVRVISARAASTKERRDYGKQR